MSNSKDITSRAEAKAAGLKHYFTGKPCKHGHVAERYVRNSSCVECDLADRANRRLKWRARELPPGYRAAIDQDLFFRSDNTIMADYGAFLFFLLPGTRVSVNVVNREAARGAFLGSWSPTSSLHRGWRDKLAAVAELPPGDDMIEDICERVLGACWTIWNHHNIEQEGAQ